MLQNWMLLIVALSYKQVDRHLRKLDQELAKFKMELEADNAGITEILERRKYVRFSFKNLTDFLTICKIKISYAC